VSAETPKPLLVGELNPYGVAPAYALYPLPINAAGYRLQRILGLGMRDYLRKFDRVNLCSRRWEMSVARARADRITAEQRQSGRAVILLGFKVCRAFGVEYVPFSATCGLRVLPHPSGRCRVWNQPGAERRARELLAEFL